MITAKEAKEISDTSEIRLKAILDTLQVAILDRAQHGSTEVITRTWVHIPRGLIDKVKKELKSNGYGILDVEGESIRFGW